MAASFLTWTEYNRPAMASKTTRKAEERSPDETGRSVPIIRTKLNRPSVPPDVVGRDRLFELMERGCDAPLTLVSAPTGYGKSVLVARWAENCRHRVAWVSLDPDESDLRFTGPETTEFLSSSSDLTISERAHTNVQEPLRHLPRRQR